MYFGGIPGTYMTAYGSIEVPAYTVRVGDKVVTVPEDVKALARRLALRRKRVARNPYHTPNVEDLACEHMVRWAQFMALNRPERLT